MRRSVLAVALLLATAPVARASETMPDIKPELRAVQVARPTVRTDAVVAPVQAERRTTKASRAAQLSQRDLTLIAVVLLVVLLAVAL